MENIRQQFKDMVMYLLKHNYTESDKELDELSETYTDSFMNGVSKWVACKDELPKGIGNNLIKYPIIIFDKEEGVIGAFYYENEENSFQTDEGLKYYNVTHWAELPEQPVCCYHYFNY